MLRLAIWGRLPFELLCRVIETTDDNDTQANWCIATRNSSALHKIAVASRYRHYSITWKQLLYSDTIPDQIHWPRQQSQYIPASFVKNLVIDCEVDSERDGIARYCVSSFWSAYMPWLDQVRSTLNRKLLPVLTQVESLLVIADETQVILDDITGSLPTLRELKYRHSSFADTSPSSKLLKWDTVTRLENLTTLSVSALELSDPTSLAQGISFLDNLKILDIQSNHEMPIQVFYRALCRPFSYQHAQDRKTCLIPESIQDITIMNIHGHHSATSKYVRIPLKECPFALDALRNMPTN